MIRDQVMPDQIHNYAHNNEWLIRDLMLIGRVKEAVDLAKNMIELPRHPKFNVLSGRGSASLGRERLLGVLSTYRLWPELIELSNSAYLEPTEDELKQDERKAWMAIAYSQVDDKPRLLKMQGEFASLLETLQAKASEGRGSWELLAEKEDKDKKEEKDKETKLV